MRRAGWVVALILGLSGCAPIPSAPVTRLLADPSATGCERDATLARMRWHDAATGTIGDWQALAGCEPVGRPQDCRWRCAE